MWKEIAGNIDRRLPPRSPLRTGLRVGGITIIVIAMIGIPVGWFLEGFGSEPLDPLDVMLWYALRAAFIPAIVIGLAAGFGRSTVEPDA